MKIAILGPVTLPSYFGGVAIFDEGLADAFQQLGHEVDLWSSQKGVDLTKNNVIHKLKISEITHVHYDLVISSLGYIKYVKFFNSHYKIYVLHGYFSVSHYGLLKSFCGILFQRAYLTRDTIVLANSHFTSFINRISAGIIAKGTIQLGVSNQFLDCVKRIGSTSRYRDPKKILYVGRLVDDKRIDVLIDAFSILVNQDKNWSLEIVGDGPELMTLKKQAMGLSASVTFTGRLNQEEIVERYLTSSFFVSLNDSEPFGITYCEALLCGCKIVAPSRGGQVELLSAHSNSAILIDQIDKKSVVNAIQQLINSTVSNDLDASNFSYLKTARQILAYCD